MVIGVVKAKPNFEIAERFKKPVVPQFVFLTTETVTRKLSGSQRDTEITLRVT